MDRLEILFFSILVVFTGAFIVWLMWQNSLLRDELNYKRENSIDLTSIQPELRSAARSVCNHHIHVFRKTRGGYGQSDSE